jgi:hypothetical protein
MTAIRRQPDLRARWQAAQKAEPDLWRSWSSIATFHDFDPRAYWQREFRRLLISDPALRAIGRSVPARARTLFSEAPNLIEPKIGIGVHQGQLSVPDQLFHRALWELTVSLLSQVDTKMAAERQFRRIVELDRSAIRQHSHRPRFEKHDNRILRGIFAHKRK